MKIKKENKLIILKKNSNTDKPVVEFIKSKRQGTSKSIFF